MKGQVAYREYYQSLDASDLSEIPWTMHPDYLDTVSIDGSWDAVFAEHQEKVCGFWVFFVKSKGPWKIIATPFLCKWMGPWLKKELRESPEYYRLMSQMITQLPSVIAIDQCWPPVMMNALPVQWKEWQVDIRYDQWIQPLREIQVMEQEFHPKTQKEIRKAEEQKIIFKQENYQSAYYQLLSEMEKRKNTFWNYPETQLQKIHQTLSTLGWNTLTYAYRENAFHPFAIAHCVRYQGCAYLLLFLSSAEAQKDRITGNCFREIFRKAKEEWNCTSFHFMGSSMQPIAYHFLKFTSQVQPYLRVRYQHPVLSWFYRIFRS